MTKEKQLLTALVEKPTTYTIDIENDSMLPELVKADAIKKADDYNKGRKKEEQIKPLFIITINSPTLHTLSHCAIHLQDLPEHLKDMQTVTLNDALPHIDTMVKVICVLASSKDDYPEWWEDFFKLNCTPKDIFQIFHEASLKMQTDFFLTSFQIASLTNPMMMRKPKGLIPSS